MASVLTQAPLPAPVHVHRPRRSHQKPVVTSSSTPVGAIAMSNHVGQKTHVIEAAHLEYASAPEQRVTADDVFAIFDPYCDSERAEDRRAFDVVPTSFSDVGHYSHTVSRPISLSAQERNAPSSRRGHSSRQSRYDELADAISRDPPAVLSTPRLVPPESEVRHQSKSKSVSIVAPSDLSHGHDHEDSHSAFDHTVSEPGHSSIYSARASTSFSGRTPRRTPYTTQSVSGHADPSYAYSSRLSWADKASVPIYRNWFPLDNMQSSLGSATLLESSSHPARRKLRKPLPRSVIATSPTSSPSGLSSSSGSSFRLWRALSMRGMARTRAPPLSHSGKSGSMFFRTCRSVSESGHDTQSVVHPTRPPPRAHASSSGSATSHSQSSSTSHSTSMLSSSSSAHSTPMTTPEYMSPVISPVDSPLAHGMDEKQDQSLMLSSHISRRKDEAPTRKLKKRRPSVALQIPPDVPQAPNSTSSKTYAHSYANAGRGNGYGFLPPINPESPFGLEIPKEFTQSARLSSPPYPLADPKRKSSTNALAQLAWTGLSSSELAALTSRLSIQQHSPERVALLGKHDLAVQHGTFDPHGECLYARGGNPKSMHINDLGERKQGFADEGSGGSSSTLGSAVSHTLSTMRKRAANPARESTSVPLASSISQHAILRSSHPDSKPHVSHTHPQPSARHAVGFLDSDPMAMRRWTLAMADVPDEVLVQELDKLRKESANRRTRYSKPGTPGGSQIGHGSDCGSDVRRSLVYGGPGSVAESKFGAQFRLEGGESDSEGEEMENGTVEELEEDEEEWKTARRALLCCRELVRTERNYQARLRQLLDAQLMHPLFSVLLTYVPTLLQASEALLVRLVDDPSAWGVSAAFIGCEEELEAALVAWCGIVGEFFADSEEKDKRGRNLSRKASEEAASVLGHGDGGVRQRSGTMPTFGVKSVSQSGFTLTTSKMVENRRLSLFSVGGGTENGGMFTAALGTGLAYGLSSPSQQHRFGKHASTASVGKDAGLGAAGTVTRTLSAWKRKSMPSSLSNLPLSISFPSSPTATSPTGDEQKLTVRDLAIQPTQRVMRYVLQYKDLLQHTPVTSPSRGLVERALESALRIAKKCDRAQDNSAFLHRP